MDTPTSSTYQPLSGAARQAKVLTVNQFYEATGKMIGLNTIRAYAKSGRIKAISIGRKVLILASEVEDFFTREAANRA